MLQIAHEHESLEGLEQYALTQSLFFERRALNQKLKGAFDEAKLSASGIYYVDTLEVQCGSGYKQCSVISLKASEFLYFDHSHFTKLGAKEFGEALKVLHPKIFRLQ